MTVDHDSFIAKARAARQALKQPREEDFDLPGYQGILKVRYTPVRYERSKELSERGFELLQQGASSADVDLQIAAETLTDMCVTFLRQNEEGQWVPWEENGVSVRFDRQLAAALEFDVNPEEDPKRAFVYGFFGGHPECDRPLMTHSFHVQAWLAEVDIRASEKSAENFGETGSSKT